MLEEIKVPSLSTADKARLMLNLPTLANRFVTFNGKRYPIIHLGIGDLEQFRAACEPIEKLYSVFANSELTIINFMKVYRDELIEVFTNAVPKAAAIALGLPEGAVIASCRPLEGFSAVLAQWLHNREIGSLQGVFPPPPDDEEEKQLPNDPSANNPMAVVQKMASAYHWSYETIILKTVPQIYLMGNDAAWDYARIKSNSGEPKKKVNKKPIVVNGEKRKNFKGMGADEYRNYLANAFNMPVPDVGVINPAGGL